MTTTPLGLQNSTLAKDPYSDSEIAKLLLLESHQPQYNSFSNSFSTGKALKTNKRFLKSVIRNVNDHNRQLERKPEGSTNVRRTVEEDGRSLYRRELSSSHDDHPRPPSRLDQEEGEEFTHRKDEYRRSKSSRSISRTHDYVHDRARRGDSDSSSFDERRQDYKKEKRSRKRSRTNDEDSHHHHGRNHHLDTSVATSSKEQKPPSNNERGLASTSKMDKYFSSTYDPRLDVNLDDITDPTTGLIQGDNYDDWEAILTQLKAKRDAKSKTKDMKLHKKLVAAHAKLRKIEKEKLKLGESSKSKRKKHLDDSDHHHDRSVDKKPSSRRHHHDSKNHSRKIDQDSPEYKGSRSRHRRNDVDETSGKRNKSSKKRTRKSYSTSAEDSSSSSTDPITRHKHIGLMDVKDYSKPGQQREWDLGKPSPT